MRIKEERNALKDEVETINKKLAEMNDDELAQVAGGDIGKIIQQSEEEARQHSWE